MGSGLANSPTAFLSPTINRWGRSSRINIKVVHRLDFSSGKWIRASGSLFIASSLSARPAESIRPTDSGCPISSLIAIISLLTLVFPCKRLRSIHPHQCSQSAATERSSSNP